MPYPSPRLTTAEDRLMRTLAVCGVLSMRQLRAGLGISPRRCAEFGAGTFLVEVSTVWVRGRYVRIARLTDAGRDYVFQAYGLQPYRTRTIQLGHDLTLAGYFLALPADLRRTWLSQDQLHQFVEGPTAGNMPDGVHRDDTGALVAVEVASHGLAGERLRRKRAYASDYLGARFILVKEGQREYAW